MAGIIGIKLNDTNGNTKQFFAIDSQTNKLNVKTKAKCNQNWIMYKFENENTLKCEVAGDGWPQMLAWLPYNDVRFVICNFEYMSPDDNIERVKRLFLMWAPDEAKVREKLKITMFSRDAQKVLGMGFGFHTILQAAEVSDIDEKNVLLRIKRNCTVF